MTVLLAPISKSVTDYGQSRRVESLSDATFPEGAQRPCGRTEILLELQSLVFAVYESAVISKGEVVSHTNPRKTILVRVPPAIRGPGPTATTLVDPRRRVGIRCDVPEECREVQQIRMATTTSGLGCRVRAAQGFVPSASSEPII